MIYSNNISTSFRLPQEDQLKRKNSLLLQANPMDIHDQLLLPSSTRSLRRRMSLFEKSRDWARRLITLHRPRRNTISNSKLRVTSDEFDRKQVTNLDYSDDTLHNYQKTFDEDGYLSPMEIKANIDDITRENTTHHLSQRNLPTNSSNASQIIYRYQDPNIRPTLSQQPKRLPNTSFATEFQKSLSVVDYIDLDVKQEDADDPLESLKYLFLEQVKQPAGNLSRRIPRRSTNVSSISTDSGYSDMLQSSSKILPLHFISCTFIPVTIDPNTLLCLTCPDRKFNPSPTIRQPSVSSKERMEVETSHQCGCQKKYYSSMTMHSSSMKLTNKNDGQKEDSYGKQQSPKRLLKKKQASLTRFPNLADDLASISRWYKPNLEREAVNDALQQADYGAFIVRNSTTHPYCYALSVKVPKFTHDLNIVHYLIERSTVSDAFTYRIKGTLKQFPTLLSLLTHHSVMPEILPIALNLNESFTI